MYHPLLIVALVFNTFLVPTYPVSHVSLTVSSTIVPVIDNTHEDMQKVVIHDAIFLIQQLQTLAREATSHGEFTASITIADNFFKDGQNSREFLMVVLVVAKYFENRSVNFSAKFNKAECLILLSWATV